MSKHQYKRFTVFELMDNMGTTSYDELISALNQLVASQLVLDYKIGPQFILLLVDTSAEIALFVEDEGEIQ